MLNFAHFSNNLNKLIMKRILTLSIAIFFIIVVSGQGSSAILGSGGDVVLIFCFEVVDSDSQWPLGGARITLRQNPEQRLEFSLVTNSDGKAVVLVKGRVGYFIGGKLKVMAEGYHYAEQDMVQWDYVKEPGPKIGIPTTDWEINDRMVINAVLSESFEPLYDATWTSSDLVTVGDYFQINVELQKIPEYR